MLDDYTDKQREITIFKDDIVEILDNEKPEKWLVRTKYKTLNQICYVPPKLLEAYDKTKIKKLDLDYQKQFVRVSENRRSKLSAFTILNSSVAQHNQNTNSIIYTRTFSDNKLIQNENANFQLIENDSDLENLSSKKSKLNDLSIAESNLKSGKSFYLGFEIKFIS